MEIAPGVAAEKWQVLRLDDPSSLDWPSAVQILEAQINERFIDPVDHLIAAEQAKPIMERRFGFTILAVDCLLVETLGAFIEGLTDTEGKSRATFCGFLTTRPLFKDEFTPDRAMRFYYEFRCGILHQAEIGGDSKVWSIGPLLQDNGSRIICLMMLSVVDSTVCRPASFSTIRASSRISNTHSSMRSLTRLPTGAYSRSGDGRSTPGLSKPSRRSTPSV